MINIVIGNWAPIYMFGEKTKYIVHRHTGQVINTMTNHEIAHTLDEDGYHKVHLYHKGKDKNFRVNRLVYISFYGDEEFNDVITQVNHINLNLDDNSLDNLEPCSCLYNIHHAIKYGARKNYYGSNCTLAKYTEDTAHQISNLIQAGYSNSTISKLLNIPMTNVSDIKRGRTWKHVSKEYNFPEYIKHKEIDIVKDIIKDIIHGERNVDIGKKYNVDHKYVSLIRNGKRHGKLYNQIKQEICEENNSTTNKNRYLEGYYNIIINMPE